MSWDLSIVHYGTIFYNVYQNELQVKNYLPQFIFAKNTWHGVTRAIRYSQLQFWKQFRGNICDTGFTVQGEVF